MKTVKFRVRAGTPLSKLIKRYEASEERTTEMLETTVDDFLEDFGHLYSHVNAVAGCLESAESKNDIAHSLTILFSMVEFQGVVDKLKQNHDYIVDALGEGPELSFRVKAALAEEYSIPDDLEIGSLGIKGDGEEGFEGEFETSPLNSELSKIFGGSADHKRSEDLQRLKQIYPGDSEDKLEMLLSLLHKELSRLGTHGYSCESIAKIRATISPDLVGKAEGSIH